jgi:hypothetical protein
MLVIPFLMFVLRRLRKVLFTGFNGGEPWSADLCQAPILYQLGQADNPRRLVTSDDESIYFAFALHNDLHVSLSCWVQALFTFLPLQGLMVSLYPGEEAFPLFTKGWELVLLTSPNIEHQVVKVQNFATYPPCYHGFTRTVRTVRTGLAP